VLLLLLLLMTTTTTTMLLVPARGSIKIDSIDRSH
jgi:hypothetical protein